MSILGCSYSAQRSYIHKVILNIITEVCLLSDLATAWPTCFAGSDAFIEFLWSTEVKMHHAHYYIFEGHPAMM